MSLSAEHVRIISSIVDESAINIKTLRDDLIDHLCCTVEIKMQNGGRFDTAVVTALQEIAPRGLESLQSQTDDLLRSPKAIFMKGMMFAIGFVSAIAVSLGWLFVTLRWPGGRELFNTGFLGLLLVFIPMIAIHRFTIARRKALSEKLRILAGSISGFIIGLSLVFKVLHLRGADVILITGVLLFTFGFLPVLFFNLYRKSTAAHV
jgi:hypothetical protein